MHYPSTTLTVFISVCRQLLRVHPQCASTCTTRLFKTLARSELQMHVLQPPYARCSCIAPPPFPPLLPLPFAPCPLSPIVAGVQGHQDSAVHTCQSWTSSVSLTMTARTKKFVWCCCSVFASYKGTTLGPLHRQIVDNGPMVSLVGPAAVSMQEEGASFLCINAKCTIVLKHVTVST